MDATLTCTECGHVITYRPEECPVLTRYEVHGDEVKAFRSRLVYCPH